METWPGIADARDRTVEEQPETPPPESSSPDLSP